MMQAGAAAKRYANALDCALKVMREEGIRALYRGALSNSLRCTSGALVLAVYYELLKHM